MLILQHLDEILLGRLQDKVFHGAEGVFYGAEAVVWWDFLGNLSVMCRLGRELKRCQLLGREVQVFGVEAAGVVVTVAAVRARRGEMSITHKASQKSTVAILLRWVSTGLCPHRGNINLDVHQKRPSQYINRPADAEIPPCIFGTFRGILSSWKAQ